MRLSNLQKSQVLTGALGNYTVEALSKAALHIYPSMKEAFRGGLNRDANKSSYPTRQNQRRFPRKVGGRGGKRPWRANEAHIDEDDDEGDEENGPEEEEWDDQEWPEEDEGEEEEEEAEDEVPYELEEAYHEAEALFTRAKKQRAEVEKARGFFKKGVSSED